MTPRGEPSWALSYRKESGFYYHANGIRDLEYNIKLNLVMYITGSNKRVYFCLFQPFLADRKKYGRRWFTGTSLDGSRPCIPARLAVCSFRQYYKLRWPLLVADGRTPGASSAFCRSLCALFFRSWPKTGLLSRQLDATDLLAVSIRISECRRRVICLEAGWGGTAGRFYWHSKDRIRISN